MGNAPSVAYADRELASAAEKGNLQRVKFLIEKDGANVNFQDTYGWSPVLHAISEGHLDVIKLLLSKGATTTHITSDRANAIHHAVTSQNESVLSFLLQYGTCDVNGTNDSGWTPLHLACLSNNYQAVKLLLSYKADPSLVNGEGKTAAEITTTPSIKSLVERGPSPRGTFDEISPDEEHKNNGMQKSLKQLQALQNPPKSPVEMKGYTYLSEEHDSNEDFLTITTSSSYENNNNNNNTNNNTSNNNNYNNNNNNNTNNDYHNNNNTASSSSNGSYRLQKSISGEPLVEREYKRIFDSIHVLRGIDPDNLNMVQVQELIEFHNSELQKYVAAKKIMEEIRAKELDLLLAE